MNKKAKQRIMNKLIEAEPSLSTDYKRQNRFKKIILMSSKCTGDKMNEERILNMLLRHIENAKQFHAAIAKSAVREEQYYGLLCGKP